MTTTSPRLQIVPSEIRDKEKIVSELKEILARAERGEIRGLVALWETATGYEHAWAGLEYEKMIGLCMRLVYVLNRRWDERKVYP